MARRNSLLVSRTLYHIGVITMIVAIVWVGIGVYLSLNKDVSTTVDTKILEPINPVIDQEVIKALSQRLIIEPKVASTSANIDQDQPQ